MSLFSLFCVIQSLEGKFRELLNLITKVNANGILARMSEMFNEIRTVPMIERVINLIFEKVILFIFLRFCYFDMCLL